LTDSPRKELSWPAAATLITAMIGVAATSVALAISPSSQEISAGNHYVTSREVGEIQARLEAIENSSRQMRVELRSDIKELRELVQQFLKRH